MFKTLILTLVCCFALIKLWGQTTTDSLVVADNFNLQQIDLFFAETKENWSSLSVKKQQESLAQAKLYLERGFLSKAVIAQKYGWLQAYQKWRDQAIFGSEQLAQLSDTLYRYPLADLQSNLPEKTACLEYFWGDSMVYLFYVDQETAQLLRLGRRSPQWERQIVDFVQQLSDPERLSLGEPDLLGPFIQESSALYARFLAPVVSLLPMRKKLLIIPDGPLYQLPFEVLLHQPAGRKRFGDLPYLFREKAIFYHYSSNLFLQEQDSLPQKGGQLLAIAGTYQQDQGRKLAVLPKKRLEIGRLARQFEGRFLLDSLATEANFKANVNRYAVIHLALHSLQEPRQPLESALAFSNITHKQEDDLLQAEEIMNLPISADLTVLSACQGAKRGQTSSALSRAFMYAGCPTTLISLWQIDDESTAVLLEDYYRQIAAGAEKSTALQRAKLKYLSENRNSLASHPIFWSAFIQFGPDQPIYLAERAVGNAVLFLASIFAGGIGLLLILSVILRWKRDNATAGVYRK
ncbi:CHAT domain-containing protein [Saprospira sp. CCB-QB6]|uniref:CHAT domain-containing protein n=1 Tax=Saprospira sp. CCB-QB6 TaxID=3023936 RepID=UPI00234BC62B|nr:CHAT domain-containing protein [Saprospira sp. CCB-QB6]WCL81194.1 CHAT domain-containing protein [Saprospira sp. CCB-QB6]